MRQRARASAKDRAFRVRTTTSLTSLLTVRFARRSLTRTACAKFAALVAAFMATATWAQDASAPVVPPPAVSPPAAVQPASPLPPAVANPPAAVEPAAPQPSADAPAPAIPIEQDAVPDAAEAAPSASPDAAASDQPTAADAPATAPGSPPTSTLPHDLTPWGMYDAADIVVKAVMIGLVIASIITWTVGLAKSLELISASASLRKSLSRISGERSLHEAIEKLRSRRGLLRAMLDASAAEVRLSSDSLNPDGVKERVASRLGRIEASAARSIARGTGMLATIGSTAPFVGLFGTVWGIMNSFIGISKAQTTNLAVVAPGIAEALLATAIGLVAAIPAVIIYNQFSRWIAGYRLLVGDAGAHVQRLVSRDLDRITSETPRSLKAAE